MKKDLSINDFMEDCRIKIWNASGDDVIKTRLEPFGYTPEKWEEGKTLFSTTQLLIAGNEKEHGEWKTAGTLFLNAQVLNRKEFTTVRQYLKYLYPAGTAEANLLDLYKDDFSKYADFKQAAQSFYPKLLRNEAILAKLAPFGYTAASVQRLNDAIASLDILRENREKESGDAQYAIKERNAKMDELGEFCNEITRLVRLVFRDDEAQYLEKLGILARS